VGRIDHVFVEDDTEITHIDIPSTNLTRVASDHLPLIVEIRIG
jgi:endonuclease/exonuclease/phosphatase family metal-dependent hydrolase